MFEVTMSEQTAKALGLDDASGLSALQLAGRAWDEYLVIESGRIWEGAFTRMDEALRVLVDEIHEDLDQHYRALTDPVRMDPQALVISFSVQGESYYEAARVRVREHRAALAELAVGLQAIYMEEKHRDRFEARATLYEIDTAVMVVTDLLSAPGLTGGAIDRNVLTELHRDVARLVQARPGAHETFTIEANRMVLLGRIMDACTRVAESMVLVTRALYWLDQWHDGE